jgi:hypothetical protein
VGKGVEHDMGKSVGKGVEDDGDVVSAAPVRGPLSCMMRKERTCTW